MILTVKMNKKWMGLYPIHFLNQLYDRKISPIQLLSEEMDYIYAPALFAQSSNTSST